MATSDLDSRVRAAAFEFLDEQTRLYGEVLPRELLSRGVIFNGTRVPLVGSHGIFKPAVTEMLLTITTAPIVEGRERPYSGRNKAKRDETRQPCLRGHRSAVRRSG